MASKISKKIPSNKPNNKRSTKTVTLAVLPQKGAMSFLVDVALVSSMFLGVGFIFMGCLGMILDTINRITIIVDK